MDLWSWPTVAIWLSASITGGILIALTIGVAPKLPFPRARNIGAIAMNLLMGAFFFGGGVVALLQTGTGKFWLTPLCIFFAYEFLKGARNDFINRPR